MLTAKPSVKGQWVYSSHIYNFGSGTFNDGVQSHDDRGINVANALLGNAAAWKVPLYLGEFSNFTLKADARWSLTRGRLMTRNQEVPDLGEDEQRQLDLLVLHPVHLPPRGCQLRDRQTHPRGHSSARHGTLTARSR